MRYVVLLCDGMADTPVEALGGKTPMEAANKPHMDALARRAEQGLVKTVDDPLPPGSDVANLSVMGYDPLRFYTGRSPLEALSIGVEMEADDVAFRCNLVTLSDAVDYADRRMDDYCAGDISTEEARQLIQAVQESLGGDGLRFYPGVSYRHCLIVAGGESHPEHFTPPHDISGRVVGEFLPQGEDGARMRALMERSVAVLEAHPVNRARVARGLRPANSIWLWGCGKKPQLAQFSDLYGLRGSVISAVDLIKGIGIGAGMHVCEVPGATGYIDTNFEGKAAAAAAELRRGQEFVYVHVEAPDECGHRGETENKVRAIELIDGKILPVLTETLDALGEDYKLLILPDHPTPLAVRTHTRDAVPFLLYHKNGEVRGEETFSEAAAARTGLFIERGCQLLPRMLGR